MGLQVSVGLLAAVGGVGDRASWIREDLEAVADVLEEQGLPRHVEPESFGPDFRSRAELKGFSFSWLSRLRRLAAHALLEPGWVPTPLTDGDDGSGDPLVEMAAVRQVHLVAHAENEGLYVPVPFDRVVTDWNGDRIPGGLLGSSQRLLAELRAIAPALGIRLEPDGRLSDAEAHAVAGDPDETAPFWIERQVWLALFEAARLSVEYGTAIFFH